MAQTSTSVFSSVDDDSRCFTHGDFNRFHDLQSSSLRYEFRRVHDKMDAGFQKVKTSLDDFAKRTDTDFEKVNDRIDRLIENTDRRFEQVDRRFEQVDRRFEQVDRRFDQMDRRFDQMDRRLDQMDRRLDSLDLSMRHMAARSRNATLNRLHQKVHVVYILDDTPMEPPHFPKNVKAFLNLRDDISSLISLCRSYECTWESWCNFHSDDPTSDSDIPSSALDRPQTLEEAVKEYTEMALRDLADVLGLDLDRLDEGLRQYEDFDLKHRQGPQEPRKRSQTSLSATHDIKRQRSSPPARQRRASPPTPQPPDAEVLKRILRDKSSSSPSLEPSIHTQLGWTANSAKLEEYREADRKRSSKAIPERLSPGSKSSQGSSQKTDA